jgi:hypothetical protein
MGVYFDYFRAADDDAARATHELVGGPLTTGPGEVGAFDGVGTKGIFPDPHLEQLVARAANVPYGRGLRTSWGLWPPPDTPPPVDETSPWLTDPSVERLATRLRDAVAAIGTADVAEVGTAWAADLFGFKAEEAADVVAGLAALARRARESGQELYCWSSL